MSDLYGYAAMRAQIAESLRVSLAYVEQRYPNAVIRQTRIDGESEGSDLTVDFVREHITHACAHCLGPTHLLEDELQAITTALNSVNYVPAGFGILASLGRRPGATEDHLKRVDAICEQFGDINHEHCVAAKLMAVTS